MQHSVSLSIASQSFSSSFNIGGKLQWPGFASTCQNQQNKFSFAASCLRKSPAWSSISLQRFKLALII